MCTWVTFLLLYFRVSKENANNFLKLWCSWGFWGIPLVDPRLCIWYWNNFFLSSMYVTVLFSFNSAKIQCCTLTTFRRVNWVFKLFAQSRSSPLKKLSQNQNTHFRDFHFLLLVIADSLRHSFVFVYFLRWTGFLADPLPFRSTWDRLALIEVSPDGKIRIVKSRRVK